MKTWKWHVIDLIQMFLDWEFQAFTYTKSAGVL